MNWGFETTQERIVSVNDTKFAIVVEVFSTEVEMAEVNANGFWDVVYVPHFLCDVQIWNDNAWEYEPFATDRSISNGTERSSQINELVKHWLDKAEKHLLSNEY